MNEPSPYSSEWKPEPPSHADRAAAMQRVKVPAMGLIVSGTLGVILNVLGLVLTLVPGSPFASDAAMYDQYGMGFLASPLVSVASTALGLAVTILMIVGGLRMRQLQGYGLAMTASILAWIPCTSPCCIVSIPFGIWAFVVLLDADVKQAFR